ncbi:hypothetical protein [Echinicola vietnamensis]|uniref:Uncharacterized protein n=1 Tax=Echinicola vietnamensis (strain DSM 17526 / LMG 23754 / KMM 6221) TaxID=926556 RepID=L0G4R8_ECHVK|nr:hypothetical protein [Echinicola vietnamensis]AGA79996.1 hypothetical protein Echvi_3784 [Echinicola vietnamensis DSM 17526]
MKKRVLDRLVRYGLLVAIGVMGACHEGLAPEEVVVYENDFNGEQLQEVRNGRWRSYNGTTVLGNYNNEEVAVQVDNLPAHKMLRITVELLLHDSWDGNAGSSSGPDIWYLNVDDQALVNTTFSNQPCMSTWCLSQSFPDAYGRHNDPKTGALETALPGLCQYADSIGWTTKYRISEIVRHKGDQLTLVCGDKTVQKYLNSSQICDESWSLSSIKVSLVE